MHSFDGMLRSQRALQELATVFDLTGLDLEITRGALRSSTAGLSIGAMVTKLDGVVLSGTIDDTCLDPDDTLRRLALALEADGVPFTLRLLDDDGVARITYESDH